jgi:tRNA dimethylallyltransferase
LIASSRALILFGPTAVGKTAVLASLATHFPDQPFEIISADSRQVYRGLDIGTAKPTREERSAIPHHLIDILDPRERWDVGRFVEEADRLVREITRRGATPILSGGTAFYLEGYLLGLPDTPRVDDEIRDELQSRLESEGVEPLHAELSRVDPEGAARIHRNDSYRILRALEVFRTSGRPLSSFRPPRERRAGVDATVIGLYRERSDLYRRIDRRVQGMFAAGLPGEVERLIVNGARRDDPGMQSIGYREFFEIGTPPPWDASVLEATETLIARNPRRYAKRQITFFRRIPAVEWVDAGGTSDDGAPSAAVLDIVGKHLHTDRSFLEHDHDDT